MLRTSLVNWMPSTRMSPRWCCSRRLMVRMKVDLPEPDGPDDDHNLALFDGGGDAAQGVEIAEPLMYVAANDDVLRAVGISVGSHGKPSVGAGS